MALLSGTTTDGRPAWDKYIRQNPKWRDITLEIERKITNVNFLQKKGISYEGTSTYLNDGDKFQLVNNNLTTFGKIKLANIKYKGKTGFIPVNKIRKPSGFDSVKDETIALENLDKLIKDIGYPIDIQLKGERGIDRTVYKGIIGARTIPGTPKADFACYSASGNEIFISHKKSGGAKAFQQYSGVTEAAGAGINRHPEVIQFMRIVSNNISNGRLENPMYAEVKDRKLINLSIFGPDYGGSFGTENCQLIGQGQAKLIPTDKDGLFYLTFDDHIALNGEVDLFTSGDYTAVLAATYRSGRGFVVDGNRFDGARLGLYPINFVKNRSGAQKV